MDKLPQLILVLGLKVRRLLKGVLPEFFRANDPLWQRKLVVAKSAFVAQEGVSQHNSPRLVVVLNKIKLDLLLWEH